MILETFIRLTSRTYPYGTEDNLVQSMIEQGIFPSNLQKDIHNNYFYKIGNSRTIFASHLDTVSRESTIVTHIFDDHMISTDGKTTLGADDKAGVTIMLHLIKNNVPGLYYFFIGEEVGCIGSGLASSISMKDFKGKYDRIISFDRRGTDSVITYQSSTRCCSDVFADSLAKQLNLSGMKYRKDEGGVYTDSAEFIDIIPECTNISVGYYKEHTFNESQDIKHLEDLSSACLLVDWENLPTQRDITKKEYKSYGYSKYNEFPTSGSDYGYHNDWYDQIPPYDSVDDWNGNYKRSRRSKKKPVDYEKDINQGLNSMSYIDNGSGLKPYDDSKTTIYYKKNTILNSNNDRNYYDNLFDKIIKDDLTKNDLKIIKEQYTDIDESFDQYLLGHACI